ncbi:MAG: EsaB/YukD family protein [Bacteroidota bacterium]
MNEEITISVRLPFDGTELEVELPLVSSGKQIINELIKGEMLPAKDPGGEPYVYKLIAKSSGDELRQEKTLGDAGVKNGDTLIVAPKVKAGGPEKLKIS